MWMSADGQGTKCRINIAKSFNRLSRVHECYRQTTDRQTTDGRASSRSLKIEWWRATATAGLPMLSWKRGRFG